MRKYKKVIVLGSGALKIGEAGEFDYSGSQAIKALKEDGIFTVLVNPNIATIQTSDYLADQVYFLPVNADFVENVIKKERPNGILLGFGGQTALQCGLDLDRRGVFDRFGVEVLGTPTQTIRETEDRDAFIQRLAEIDVEVPKAFAVSSVEDALKAARRIGFPVMMRVAYALGGLSSGICTDERSVVERAKVALVQSPQLLIEEYLAGWKEIEFEVMRDGADNCITVCNMENLDPMGIHTGESIVVAPSQTLNNREYHLLREVSIRVARHIGIVGECNIQFAVDPDSDNFKVIEVNARLSRSSALASKATGYPIAFVAAKLTLGHHLPSIKNSVTGVTTACFEPALDYVVVKVPKWDLQKFQKVSKRIGSSMKSVGEVMAIGRTFEEALQKALRMVRSDNMGLVGDQRISFGDLEAELQNPTSERIYAIAKAIETGMSIDRIHKLSLIDKWFLYKIENICRIASELKRYELDDCACPLILKAKKYGFSDAQIAKYTQATPERVTAKRKEMGVAPYVKQIDTLGAEYPAQTNYLYLTYNGAEDDVAFDGENAIIILGSGAYSIGSSVEFDWCCVNTAVTLRNLGFQTIVVNHNPETVSTDYSESDRLYFEELSTETILEIYAKENPIGVIVSVGGQIANNLAFKLYRNGAHILGTTPEKIDNAEDRKKFSSLLDRLKVKQPSWTEAESIDVAEAFAEKVGYPVLIRPSYVLSGASMGVASNSIELIRILKSAVEVSKEYPVVLTKFVENAKELDVDAVAQDGTLILWAISEHVENAGVHSGDATLVHPPQRTYIETIRRVKHITTKIAGALQINGPFNIQFIAKDNQISVIECNLRASRSFPFVSKVQKVNYIDRATRVIVGKPVMPCNNIAFDLNYVGVKAPQFSFLRLDGADPVVGVEMASTGEVACLGDDFEEAFLKALFAIGFKYPIKSALLSTGPIHAKAAFLEEARIMEQDGIQLYATQGTADFLHKYDIQATVLKWPLERDTPNVLDFLSNGHIDIVINIPKNYHEEELTNDYLIRRNAVNYGIPLITNIQLAQRFVEAYFTKAIEDLMVKSWSEYDAMPISYREPSYCVSN
jgi:carbamoyl-phosphate synthase large subunit